MLIKEPAFCGSEPEVSALPLGRFLMKILNLYAGIGGNRKLWGDNHKITAVELRPEIAAIYQDFFPNDRVIVGDAHQYLQEHYAEFDFIWSSPPCQSHSKLRGITCVAKGQSKEGGHFLHTFLAFV